jgi:HEPN domain-containing protein
LTKSLELARELGYKDASLIEEHSEDIAKAYEEKRYDDIEKWLEQDLYAIRYLDLSGALAKLIEHLLEKGRTLFQRTE